MTSRIILVIACALTFAPEALASERDREPGNAAGATQTAAATALSEARLLAAALNSLTGLTASFTQTLESAALPSPQVERGVLYLLRPGRMRLDYQDPKGKLAIADGRRTYLYLPEDRQAVSAPLEPRRSRSGVGLLLEERLDLVSDFEISWDGSSGTRLLKLVPRSTGTDYQFLLVETDGDHLIRSLTVVDPLGGRVTYRFEHLTRVEALDPSLFRFVAPKGVALEEAAP